MRLLLRDLEEGSGACLGSVVVFLNASNRDLKALWKMIKQSSQAKGWQRVATWFLVRRSQVPSLELGLRLSLSLCPLCALSSVSPLLLLCCPCDCMADPLQAQQSRLAVKSQVCHGVRLHPEVFSLWGSREAGENRQSPGLHLTTYKLSETQMPPTHLWHLYAANLCHVSRVLQCPPPPLHTLREVVQAVFSRMLLFYITLVFSFYGIQHKVYLCFFALWLND